jgi:hypothetical protein
MDEEEFQELVMEQRGFEMEAYLLDRGVATRESEVMGILLSRTLVHIERCHNSISYLLQAFRDNSLVCPGKCHPICQQHWQAREARRLLKWENNPKELF